MLACKKILYIDDDEDDLAIFEQALLTVNNEIEFFSHSSGQAALNVLKNGECVPGVIFLDLNMPVLDGFEILQQLKKEGFLLAIPVVIFSTAKTHNNNLKPLI